MESKELVKDILQKANDTKILFVLSFGTESKAVLCRIAEKMSVQKHQIRGVCNIYDPIFMNDLCSEFSCELAGDDKTSVFLIDFEGFLSGAYFTEEKLKILSPFALLANVVIAVAKGAFMAIQKQPFEKCIHVLDSFRDNDMNQRYRINVIDKVDFKKKDYETVKDEVKNAFERKKINDIFDDFIPLPKYTAKNNFDEQSSHYKNCFYKIMKELIDKLKQFKPIAFSNWEQAFSVFEKVSDDTNVLNTQSLNEYLEKNGLEIRRKIKSEAFKKNNEEFTQRNMNCTSNQQSSKLSESEKISSKQETPESSERKKISSKQFSNLMHSFVFKFD